ncbi:ATP-binding protein [Aurantimonas sp. VKM B-3413]|uniref:ATP-binding protein n=1 Tax=Aurantimonas sp. VKM B-3413 TaxID=2779401 RepID=UPI001E3D51B3|nr:ATP-binding protein [Aurantimonas sp. VKM B-3413]MCB8838044.1 two-component sensor histidine kinase [Aurantimonas sp. VKM B-3413]
MSRTMAADEDSTRVRLAGRRAKRILAASGACLGLLGWSHPEVALGCLAVFVVIALVVLWPSRAGMAQERMQAEARSELVWPGRGMKAIVEALQEPAFILDRGLLLRYRNPASFVAFGNMTLGDPFSLRFRAPELIAAVESAIRNQAPGQATLDERRPIERTWQVEILPVPAYQGESPHFFLVLFRDRTAERRTERMRTDFVANASHELRTPLASLTGFIETLQGPARNDAQARERFLAIMREQAQRMSRLIDDLLSLSRIEMKRHLPVNARADLVSVLRKVQVQMAPLAEELGMTVEFSPVEEAVLVVGDEDELIQVFANLVENACKYAESGQRVELSIAHETERGEPVIDASVRDFGPGIPPEHVPRLTERFYRVSVGSSRAKQGTGLGLSIVRNILLRHKSRLLVQSEIGRGTIFTARFPATASESPIQPLVQYYS